MSNAEFLTVIPQRVDLFFGNRIENRQTAVAGWHIVIGCGDGPLRTPHFPSSEPQALKRLGAGHLVYQLQVNVQNRLPTRFLVDDVVIPNLLKERAWLHGQQVA